MEPCVTHVRSFPVERQSILLSFAGDFACLYAIGFGLTIDPTPKLLQERAHSELLNSWQLLHPLQSIPRTNLDDRLLNGTDREIDFFRRHTEG